MIGYAVKGHESKNDQELIVTGETLTCEIVKSWCVRTYQIRQDCYYKSATEHSSNR
jgi:hypothetical protein